MGGGPGPVEGVKLEVWNFLCEFRVSNEMGKHWELIIIWKYPSCELVYSTVGGPLKKRVLKRATQIWASWEWLRKAH